ncbi:MAG TPA: GNAT family protein [Candidatus Paceibacterota bacterium]|nr:GNAT family protein [Candidatus Paceibacterota bacterium]
MIYIRNHHRKDIPYRITWLNDELVNKYLGGDPKVKTTEKRQQEWFDRYEKSKDKKFFTICDEKIPVGFMGLTKIDKANKHADIFIAIGASAYRGKGFGRAALSYLIDFGFNTLKLHKLSLSVAAENLKAVKFYKKSGFKLEGKIKDDYFDENKFHDTYLMALFPSNKKNNA